MKFKKSAAGSNTDLARIDESPAELNFAPPASGLTSPPYHHQIPPYGKLGQPYIITKYDLAHPPLYNVAAATGHTRTSTTTATKNRFRLDWSVWQKNRLTEQLRRCFPFVYVLSHCAWVLLNSIIQIALQIALMATNGALWWVGAGIWAGVYFIVMALLTLLLVRVRNYWLFVITYIMHIIGVLVAIGAYLIVNIIGIDEYRFFCTYFPDCFNSSVKVLSYLLFWFGVILIIFLLIYIVIMPFWIMDIPNEWSRYRRERKAEKATLNQQQSRYNQQQMTTTTIEEKGGDLAKHGSLYVQTDLEYDPKENVYYYTPPLPPTTNAYHNYSYEQIS